MTPTTQAIDQATSQILPVTTLALFPSFLEYKEGDVVGSTTIFDHLWEAFGEYEEACLRSNPWHEEEFLRRAWLPQTGEARKTVVTLGPRNPDGTWLIASITGFFDEFLQETWNARYHTDEPLVLRWNGFNFQTPSVNVQECIIGANFHGPLHF